MAVWTSPSTVQVVIHSVSGQPGSFGRAVSGAGDVDNDDFHDFVLGPPVDYPHAWLARSCKRQRCSSEVSRSGPFDSVCSGTRCIV